MTVTIKAVRFISPDEPARMEDVEALSDPDEPLVITRLTALGNYTDDHVLPDDCIAIVHKASGKKIYLPWSLRAAELALPELLKLTDWSVPAEALSKDVFLRARVEVVQDSANRKAEDEDTTRMRANMKGVP